MKKVLFVFVFMIMTSFAMNAQISASNSDFEFRGGKFYQSGTEVSPAQLSNLFGQESYDNLYLPAKKMRTAGVACLSAGCGVAAVGAGLIIYGVIDGNSEGGSAFGGMAAVGTGGIVASVGAIAAITGGILMGSANKKMKNLRPATSGVGLAMSF